MASVLRKKGCSRIPMTPIPNLWLWWYDTLWAVLLLLRGRGQLSYWVVMQRSLEAKRRVFVYTLRPAKQPSRRGKRLSWRQSSKGHACSCTVEVRRLWGKDVGGCHISIWLPLRWEKHFSTSLPMKRAQHESPGLNPSPKTELNSEVFERNNEHYSLQAKGTN